MLEPRSNLEQAVRYREIVQEILEKLVGILEVGPAEFFRVYVPKDGRTSY
jgi:hypothetical protein